MVGVTWAPVNGLGVDDGTGKPSTIIVGVTKAERHCAALAQFKYIVIYSFNIVVPICFNSIQISPPISTIYWVNYSGAYH